MKQEHRYALQLKLDQLWYEGSIRPLELLSFFNQDRVTRSV